MNAKRTYTMKFHKQFIYCLLIVIPSLVTSCRSSIDYTDRNNWVIFEENPKHEGDMLYIYPTLVGESLTGTVPIDDTIMRKLAPEVFKNQVGSIAEITNAYAPYYRQMSLNIVDSFFCYDDVSESIRGMRAKKDIFDALDYYFKEVNNGRPYILAGHSQGSVLLQIVLDEYMPKHPDYYKKMVACYAPGYGFAKSWYDNHPGVKYAKGETDTGVVVSWNIEAPGATERNLILPDDDISINPLNWKTDTTYAPKEENLDGVHDAQINSVRTL